MKQQLTDQDKIDTEMRNLIEEARVILPGVQALFGFQTIVVFNDHFAELPSFAKNCHLVGLALVIITVAMVMTPAIYYRACGGCATLPMTRLSSLMIRGALAPLACGLALDMFTVIFTATENVGISIGAGVGTIVLLAGLWFVVPRHGRKHMKKRR
jgi:hypothetical protein